MNAIPMLERCGRGQANQDYDAGLPATYLAPPQAWREQESLSDPQYTHPMSCED